MQRRKTLTGLAGIAAAALLAAAAWAATQQAGDSTPAELPARGGHGGHAFGLMMPDFMSPRMLDHVAVQLGLSTEQQQTIKGFLEQARPGFQQLHKQLHANAELLINTRPDDANYTSIVANVSQASSELTARFVQQASQLRSQVFGVLTADQRAKLEQLQATMTAHWQQRHTAWHGAAPPTGNPAMPD